MASPPLPDFVNLAGWQLYQQPFFFSDCTIYSFLVKAVRERLQQFCDRYLNARFPAAADIRYHVIGSHVLVTVVDIPRLWPVDSSSGPPNPDRGKGWLQEIDFAFWLPAVRLRRHLGIWLPDELVFLPPYLFVNNPLTMVAGRETYGFPKDLASVRIPQPLSSGAITLDTLLAGTFTPQTQWKVARLAELVPAAPASLSADATWSAPAVVLEQIVKRLFGAEFDGRVQLPGSNLQHKLFNLLPAASARMVFLKQFRDIHDAGQACYQAITEASFEVVQFREAGLLVGDYRLRLTPNAAYPIAEDLGLIAGEQPVEFATYAKLDFRIGTGEEVYRVGAPSAAVAPSATSQAQARKKIAILGGGTGALAAAFGITDDPDWQKKFDVTVYQMGWRLGGKGASGRNRDVAERIEEHGLHIWAGFYENAFRMMRRCYKELGRAAGQPLATVWDAFKPHSDITLTEQVGGGWIDWQVAVPTNPAEPGDGGVLPTPWDYVVEIIEWVDRLLVKSPYAAAPSPAATSLAKPSWIDELLSHAENELKSLANHGAVPSLQGAVAGARADLSVAPQGPLHALLRRALALARWLREVERHLAVHHTALVWLLKAFKRLLSDLLCDRLPGDDEARRLWILVDLGLSSLFGIIADNVLHNGFFSIDDEEWMAWLRRHGASELAVQSAVVRGTYDYVFGYRRGDVSRPSIGAGTCTHGLLRLAFTYKGAVFWEMQAGMGDTVFAPLYQVLKRRGVRFEFFQEVKNLRLSADKTAIAAIDMARQVRLKEPDRGYEPLIDVKGLPCWPSTPLYDQLVLGAELEHRGINLESPWTDWTPVETYTLKAGADFDLVVLGISLGALPSIAQELLAANSHWRRMVDGVQTVSTQALQMWLKPDAAGLGWQGPPTVLTAYADPHNTWGDLSHLIARESWPSDTAPTSEAYFCGPSPDPATIPPTSDHDYPARAAAQAQSAALAWLKQNIGFLWPNFVDADGIRWDLLADLGGGAGEVRFHSQYVRVNINPSERYVLSLPGSSSARLKADESGFSNLYLAGDWVWTAVNAGCIEAAVMGGWQASRAICGYPRDVIGKLT